jgi:hypothetical protein
MSNENWYCNDTWNAEIEVRFFDRLNRARGHRQHYIATQARKLAESHPHVALRLLDLEGPGWNPGMRAEIMLALGKVSEAMSCYRMALDQEALRGNTHNSIHLTYALVVAERRISSEFADANAALDRYERHLTWPLEHFEWNAAKALLLKSAVHVRRALEFAEAKHSGFRYHSKLGLVGSSQDSLTQRLREILDNPAGEREIGELLVAWKGQVRIAPAVIPPRELSRRRQVAQLEKECEPVRADLQKVGVVVERLSDLGSKGYEPEIFVPILLSHIDRDYPLSVRRLILSVLEPLEPNETISRKLIEVFEAEPKDSAFKDALGWFLGRRAHPGDVERIAAIAANPRHGDSRIYLSCCLAKHLEKDAAFRVLRPFIHKDQIPWKPVGKNAPSPPAASVIDALGVASIIEAREDILPWTQHNDSYTRDRAKRALRKIDTAMRRMQKKPKEARPG